MAAGFPQGSLLSKANQEWVIDFCRFRQAWVRPPNPRGMSMGEGIFIAHPDTGITAHPELVAPYYRRDLALNFYDPKRSPTADDPLTGPFPSHGTSIASVIVSPKGHHDGTIYPDNSRFDPESSTAFVSGVAPRATVIPFRVTNSVKLDDNSDAALVKCIYYCIALQNRNPDPIDVAVMSVSLGRPTWLGGVENKVKFALQDARKNGIVICAAAGQAIGNVTDPVFPGSDPNTICVGACADDFSALSTGHYGPAIDITAAGVGVWRAESRLRRGAQTPEFVVAPSSGSSYATAITAGACALWQAYHGRAKLIEDYGRELIFDLFLYCLRASARLTRPPVWDALNRGAGVLDADTLLDIVLPPKEDFVLLPNE